MSFARRIFSYNVHSVLSSTKRRIHSIPYMFSSSPLMYLLNWQHNPQQLLFSCHRIYFPHQQSMVPTVVTNNLYFILLLCGMIKNGPYVIIYYCNSSRVGQQHLLWLIMVTIFESNTLILIKYRIIIWDNNKKTIQTKIKKIILI